VVDVGAVVGVVDDVEGAAPAGAAADEEVDEVDEVTMPSPPENWPTVSVAPSRKGTRSWDPCPAGGTARSSGGSGLTDGLAVALLVLDATDALPWVGASEVDEVRSKESPETERAVALSARAVVRPREGVWLAAGMVGPCGVAMWWWCGSGVNLTATAKGRLGAAAGTKDEVNSRGRSPGWRGRQACR
jgi:hypothetical protein